MSQILKLAHENQQLKRQINQYQQVLGVSPYVDDSLFKGGYRVVKTIADRDAIKCCWRKQGMKVVVIGEDLSFKEYVLKTDNCKENIWEEINVTVEENEVFLIEDYSELSENLTTQKELNLILKQLILNLQTQIDSIELTDEKVQITEATDFAQIGQTQKNFNKNVSNYKTNSDLKNQEQDERLENLEGINYVWSPTNRTLTLYDSNGTQLSQVSLVSLDNEGTDLRYNATTLSLELYNKDNELLDSIPVSSFIGSVGTQLQLNSNQLQLRDSQGNVLSTVSFAVSNIQGLQTALDGKLDKGTYSGTAQDLKNNIEELNEAWWELENKLKLKYNNALETEAVDVIQRVDINTGENVNYRKTTTWYDGSAMNDSKVDGINYKKIGGKFYKRAGVSGEEINILHLGAKNEPNFDNTTILQYAVDNYKIVFIPNGVFEFTRFKVTKEGVRIFGLGSGISVLSSTNTYQSGIHLEPNIWVLNHSCIIEGITSTFTNVPDWKVTAIGQNPINNDANLSIGWSEAYAPSNTFLVKNVTIKNCEVIGSYVQGIAIGVSENVKILNNKVSQIRGTAIFGYYASKITVDGNEVWFTGDDGIYMSGNGTSIYSPHAMNENVLIQNNCVHDVGTKGIGISGCSSAVIKNNIINNTWVEGIMAEYDTAGGHVTPKNVKILNNVLTNIFGNFGGIYKHSQNAIETVGGQYGAIKTFNKENDYSIYEINGNHIEVSEKVLSVGGLYSAIILGFNTNFYNNNLPNIGGINMFVGTLYDQTGSENIIIKGNNIKSNYRNILLVKTKKTKIINNNFYAPDYGILTDQTEDIKVIGNFGYINTIFFLNQTNDLGVVLENNFFDINNS